MVASAMERYRRRRRDHPEKTIRNYALHLALIVRRRGTMLALYDRYEPRRKVGEYRTWLGVERAIRAYANRWLRENSSVTSRMSRNK
jgi:hypothetical protein